MATTITNMISSKVISNLDTYNYTVQTAALHYVSLVINEIPPSGITITIKQNSTTLASTSAPNIAQQVIQLAATTNCAVNDVLSDGWRIVADAKESAPAHQVHQRAAAPDGFPHRAAMGIRRRDADPFRWYGKAVDRPGEQDNPLRAPALHQLCLE